VPLVAVSAGDGAKALSPVRAILFSKYKLGNLVATLELLLWFPSNFPGILSWIFVTFCLCAKCLFYHGTRMAVLTL
jgi:hypothetical protein